MGEWRFDSFKRWDPGASPSFSAQGPPEVLGRLAQEIWDEPGLRNTEPVILIVMDDHVALLDVTFVVGVDATFRRDPVVRVRWRTEPVPRDRGDAFGQAFFAWLERDALNGNLYEKANYDWADKRRNQHLAAAIDLVRLLDGPAQLLPVPMAIERERMQSALIARIAMRLSNDQLQPALVWCDRGLGEWLDQGFHVLDVASPRQLGDSPSVQDLAGSLQGDLTSLAAGAAANGGGSLYVGLQRQALYEAVVQAAFPSINLTDAPAALDLLRHHDESQRDLVLGRLTPAFRQRLAALGTPCVADGRVVRGPGGVFRFRSPDLASYKEVSGLGIPEAVTLAFGAALPPHEAIEVLPQDMSKWPGPTLAWFASRRTQDFLARWRPVAMKPEGKAIAQEVIQLVPAPDDLPIDLLWRADPEGVAVRHGLSLAAYCEALDPADLPQVPPSAVDADWWLGQAPNVIAVMPEGVALLLPLIEEASTPLSAETSQAMWDAAGPDQQVTLHGLMAGEILIPGVVQQTLRVWLETRVEAWLGLMPEPGARVLAWVLDAELALTPEAPLHERNEKALFWRYVAYRQHLGPRFTPLPVGQCLAARFPDAYWRVLLHWPGDCDLGPVLFDLWIHGPEGILADVAPPPDVEALAAQLICSGAIAGIQNHAAWDALALRAEAWQGALEWARLMVRDPDEALRRLDADAETGQLARAHGWQQVAVLDPAAAWAESVWAVLVGLGPDDPRWQRLLSTLPDQQRTELVRISRGLLKPGWVQGNP
jgi:hypothetical protein